MLKKVKMCKNITLVISIALLLPIDLSAQIKFMSFGEIYPDHVKIIRETGPLQPMEEVRDTVMRRIMDGFRRTNMEEIKEHLSPKLQDEITIIDSLLNIYEKKYESVDSIYLKENSGYAQGMNGITAITMFTHRTKGSLSIDYQYYRFDKIKVNKISINGKIFPSDIKRIYELESLVEKRSLNANEKFMAYAELIKLLTPSQGGKINDFCLPQSNNKLSRLNGSMSWYALNIGKNQIAVEAANRGLDLNPDNKWIYTNLALGLAQTGEIDRARKIYLRLKDDHFNERSYKDIFLADIKDLESNGIEVPYKMKIHEILNED